jgi:hypothetical protein
LDRGPADFDITHNFVYSATWTIPTPQSFNGNAFAKGVLANWGIGGIFQARTGAPFSVTLQNDRANTGNRTSGSTGGGQRPDFVEMPGCSVNAINPGNLTNYIKTQCFAYPAANELGNLGRNTLRGPGLQEFDPSLFKNWAVKEQVRIQFRAEFFNILNHPNFQMRSPKLFDGSGNIVPTATVITSPTANPARQIQFGLRVNW